ncbi:MAG: glycosyltransferase family 2 protein [Caldilineaceae bacterium]|nr:glycosyltransferase family 2 protein [Caldilineaceae bacterium]
MSQPYVVSVILNTNRRQDTLACLASLAQSTYANHDIIVLDNHSTDGSVAAICAAFPAVQVIAITDNQGYAGNNNVGIAAAVAQGADWVFVLNEDTIVDPACLEHLVRVGENNPQLGIVGPLVYHHDEPAIIQSAGGMLSRHWDSWHLAQDEPDRGQFREPHPVDFISGCGILVRRRVIEQVGMLDVRFFYYKEETEWCLRTRRRGWQINLVPQAKLWHKGVQRNHRPKPHVTYYSTRNLFLLLNKHHAPLSVWIVAWGNKFRTITSWTLRPKWRAMRQHRNAMVRGIVDFLCRRWGQMPS